MGRTRKTVHASLGMSLVRHKKPQWDRSTNAEQQHVTSDSNSSALKSVTEENSYDEFIATATLAGKEFTAEKLNVKFVGLSMSGRKQDDDEELMTEEEKKLVVVPRRPRWTKEMTAEELDEAEREAFLEWRRAMAHLQNKEGITPFERNVEVWRQLWRVVERSHVVVQIVDARHPLLYRCDDLEEYVKEMGKRNILLINKADFLTKHQRSCWSQYFDSIGLPHAFYSAAEATKTHEAEVAALKRNEAIEEEENEDEETEDEGDASNDDENENARNEPELEKGLLKSRILNREDLIDFLRSFKGEEGSGDDLFAVGLVGYPNVGKSSTINSLMAAKKTSVSATPGKTKHFQTLFLEKDILLCDCPGLVMPAFGGNKGEMVLGGILPIDQLTSYSAAADLLVERIHLRVLQSKYGVSLPVNYTSDDFLNSYASLRGFMTVRGIPDCSRAARIVLKDYVNGKICYCHPPPNLAETDFQPSVNAVDERTGRLPPPESQKPRPMGLKTRMEKALDRSFFTPAAPQAHFKGAQMISSGLSDVSSTRSTIEDPKPWKRHGNKNKKEKLRRLYRHLDVE